MYNLNDALNTKNFIMEDSAGIGHVSLEAVSILNFYDRSDSDT